MFKGSGSSSSASKVVRSVITTDSPSIAADDILNLSGNSYTITLPTAVGFAGAEFELLHSGTSLTQVYTLATTGGQTIGGVASGAYALYTNGEYLRIFSDGTNWLISDHKTSTDWTNSGVLVITATTLAPTKGNSPTVDKVWWRRNGRDAQIRMEYKNSVITGSAAGTGDYLFAIPTNLTIDTNFVTVYATVVGTNPPRFTNSVGSCEASNSTATGIGSVGVYDTTKVRFGVTAPGAAGVINGGFNHINDASTAYCANFSVPILNWKP